MSNKTGAEPRSSDWWQVKSMLWAKKMQAIKPKLDIMYKIINEEAARLAKLGYKYVETYHVNVVKAIHDYTRFCQDAELEYTSALGKAYQTKSLLDHSLDLFELYNKHTAEKTAPKPKRIKKGEGKSARKGEGS